MKRWTNAQAAALQAETGRVVAQILQTIDRAIKAVEGRARAPRKRQRRRR